MGKIICVVNQKGGVGKTATAVNLAAALAILDKKTLLIDFDPQGNATSGVGANKREFQYSIYNLLIDHLDPAGLILPTDIQIATVAMVPMPPSWAERSSSTTDLPARRAAMGMCAPLSQARSTVDQGAAT